jgi:hypothetical protein
MYKLVKQPFKAVENVVKKLFSKVFQSLKAKGPSNFEDWLIVELVTQEWRICWVVVKESTILQRNLDRSEV